MSWFRGGTFGKENYWDLPVEGYSLARYLSERGAAVATLDPLGTGGSVCELNGYELAPAIMAGAVNAALASLRADLASRPFTVLVGHSMGGWQVAGAQAGHKSADALVVCGMPNALEPIPGFTPEVIQRLTTFDASGYVSAPSEVFYPFFYGGELPPSNVLAAINAGALPIPAALLQSTMRSGAMEEYARAIDVPVLLWFTAGDPVAEPLRELSLYTASPSRTCYEQEAAAHCGTFAPSRLRAWEFLLRWADWIQGAYFIKNST